MEKFILEVLLVSVTVIFTLVGVIYKVMNKKLDETITNIKEGLAAKVDGTEYVIKSKWQEAEYGDLKLTIKELRASNDASHQAIMIELKRTNDILKVGKQK